jgi:hypothetical protein
MPTTSALQAVPVPTTGDAPTIPANMLSHVQYMEKRLVMRFADATARDATITVGNRENGMVAYLTTPKLFTFYDGTQWLPLISTLLSPVIAAVDAVNSGGQLTLVGAASNKSWGIKSQAGTLVFRYDFQGTPADILTLAQTSVTIANGKTFVREGVAQPVLRSSSTAPVNATGNDGDWWAVHAA